MTPPATIASAPFAPMLAPLAPPGAAPVLVAVTGTDDDDVLRAARVLATHRSAPLAVVTVAEPLPLYFVGGETIVVTPPDDERERRAALLARVRQQARDVIGPDAGASVEVRYGDPAQEITAAARACGASVIVVGIGRHRPLDRLLGAETALRIIRHADRPVLAVAAPLDAAPTRVVVATDFSPASARAAELAVPLVDPAASMTCVHVWRRSDLTSPWLAASEDAYARALPSRLARFARAIDAPSTLAWHSAALEGTPAERILTFAHDHAADLIVVGRQTHAWIERLLVGSVATAVLRGATCAVLVTPDPDVVETERLRRLVAGTSEGTHPEEWRAQLDGFSRRNADRRTTIEEDDPTLGAQLLASGLRFHGATYDPHDRRVELMLGEPGPGARRLTHSVGDVHAIGVLTGDDRRDTALSVRHGAGQTLLTFRDAGDDATPDGG
ncbi:MAG: universal stress protein [Gemmatirosa sp.]|nr:universal stress protein [Gemmatirosa sp.]